MNLIKEIDLDILGEIILYLEPVEVLWIMFDNLIKERLYNESINDPTSKISKIWKKKIETDLTTINPNLKTYFSFIKNPFLWGDDLLSNVFKYNFDVLLLKWINQGFQLTQKTMEKSEYLLYQVDEKMFNLIIDNMSMDDIQNSSIDKCKILKRLYETHRVSLKEIVNFLLQKNSDFWTTSMSNIYMPYNYNIKVLPLILGSSECNLYFNWDDYKNKNFHNIFEDCDVFDRHLDSNWCFIRINVGLFLIDHHKIEPHELSVLYKYATVNYKDNLEKNLEKKIELFREIRKRNVPFNSSVAKSIISWLDPSHLYDLLKENNIITLEDHDTMFKNVFVNTALFFNLLNSDYNQHNVLIKYEVKLARSEILNYFNKRADWSTKRLNIKTLVYLLKQTFPNIDFMENESKDENIVLSIEQIGTNNYNLLHKIFGNVILDFELREPSKTEIALFFIKRGFRLSKEKPFLKIFKPSEYGIVEGIKYKLQCFDNYMDPTFWILFFPKFIKKCGVRSVQEILSYREHPFTHKELELYLPLSQNNTNLSLVIQKFNPTITVRSIEKFIDTLV